nr:MAG TPA: hypothetical protein [Bacteriophage sp.]
MAIGCANAVFIILLKLHIFCLSQKCRICVTICDFFYAKI